LLWERLARDFVFDELHAKKQSEAANIANIRMRLQYRESSAQFLSGGIHTFEKLVRLKIIENGVSRGGGDGMRLVGESMHEGAGAARERFHDARGNEHRAKRRVTAGDSLAQQNHVRLKAPVLYGERFSGAAHAAHDLVGDQ